MMLLVNTVFQCNLLHVKQSYFNMEVILPSVFQPPTFFLDVYKHETDTTLLALIKNITTSEH